MTGSTYLDFDQARNKGMKLIRTGENPIAGLMIVVGINVGLRVSDLLSLTFGDLRKEQLTIVEKKTGKTRQFKINDNIRQAMQYFEDETSYPDSFHAFRSQKKTVFSNKHVNRLLQRYFSGERISSHSLRKTFGRRVWDMNNQSDKALITLSHIFNHKDVSTTRTYLGIRQEELDDIYLNL